MVSNSDMARTIAERATERVRKAWRLWPWPDLTITEERAFRTIWNSTRQFRVVGENGKPDEVFYLGVNPDTADYTSQGYYRVKANAPGDPPVGTAPTNTTYFEVFTLVDKFIALDQTCRRPIGEMIGVYKGNPRLSCPEPLSYVRSEKGIDVSRYCSGWSVFVKYLMKPEKFTMTPYIGSKMYVRNDLVYDFLTGECYVALVDSTGHEPTETSYWRRSQFPEFLQDYVKAGAYADGLKESDETATAEQVTVRRQTKADADAEANDALYREIDLLIAQGQKFSYYKRWWRWAGWGWCYSPPYTNGSTVTTLTDECDEESFQPEPPSQGIHWEYHPEITALAGGGSSLAAFDATLWLVGSRIDLLIGGQAQSHYLKSGAADALDPGHTAMANYNAATNNKHWERGL